jgi:hypothetical protein
MRYYQEKQGRPGGWLPNHIIIEGLPNIYNAKDYNEQESSYQNHVFSTRNYFDISSPNFHRTNTL